MGTKTQRRKARQAARAAAAEMADRMRINRMAVQYVKPNNSQLIDYSGELTGEVRGIHRVTIREPRYQTLYERRALDEDLYRACKWYAHVNEAAGSGLTRCALNVGTGGGSLFGDPPPNEWAAQAAFEIDWAHGLFDREIVREGVTADLRIERAVIDAVVLQDMTFQELGKLLYPDLSIRTSEVKASKLFKVAVTRLLLGLRMRHPWWFGEPRIRDATIAEAGGKPQIVQDEWEVPPSPVTVEIDLPKHVLVG